MNGLVAWREQWKLEPALVAAALFVSPTYLERLEAGELEPSLELATRLHVLTAGAVPVTVWPTLNPRDNSIVTAVAMQEDGRWGVGVIMGAVPITWLSLRHASKLEFDIAHAIATANGDTVPA